MIQSTHRRRGLLRRLAQALLLVIAICAAQGTPARAANPQGGSIFYLPTLLRGYRPVAAGLPIDPYATHSGEGTYYDATGAGNCSFPPSPENLMVAAMNELDYGNAIYCGTFIEITGPQGSVVVRIVDRCPECAPGDVDMSPQAFAQIAPLVAGRVPITWHLVDPGITSPIRLHWKDGSSQWWGAIQVRNHRSGIFKLEYLSGGVFHEINRERYNYFVQPGIGPGPHTLRITDFYGRTVIQNNVPVLDNAETPTTVQFPALP